MAPNTHAYRLSRALVEAHVRSPESLLDEAIIGTAVDDARSGQFVSLDSVWVGLDDVDARLLLAEGVDVRAEPC